jgi:hypothetical protein
MTVFSRLLMIQVAAAQRIFRGLENQLLTGDLESPEASEEGSQTDLEQANQRLLAGETARQSASCTAEYPYGNVYNRYCCKCEKDRHGKLDKLSGSKTCLDATYPFCEKCGAKTCTNFID